MTKSIVILLAVLRQQNYIIFPTSIDMETFQVIECGAEIQLKYFKFHGLPISTQKLLLGENCTSNKSDMSRLLQKLEYHFLNNLKMHYLGMNFRRIEPIAARHSMFDEPFSESKKTHIFSFLFSFHFNNRFIFLRYQKAGFVRSSFWLLAAVLAREKISILRHYCLGTTQ